MKRVFYITRTLPDGNTGGALIRRGSIHFLESNGYQVIVVAPSKHTVISGEKILIKGLHNKLSLQWNRFLFGLGLQSDYLENWAKRAKRRLLSIINKEDIVLATSGGELGTLMLASYLKNEIGCKTVYNLHDPIVFTLIEGEYSYKSKYKIKPRDTIERKVFEAADNIVTSSNYYAEVLKTKYPSLAFRVSYHHFGYIEEITKPQDQLLHNDYINVVYGGNMGHLQGPEILFKVAEYFPNIRFTLIGNLSLSNDSLPSNVRLLPLMPHKEYVDYLVSNADIGFFSLIGNVSRLCVPSKLYEYINAGIPILAAIEGDSRIIINDNGFGVATEYAVEALKEGLSALLNEGRLLKAKKNLLLKRKEWYMGNTVSELIKALN